MRFHHSWKWLGAALCAGMLLTGCGQSDDTKLVMATDATFPPYEYHEQGKIVGIDVDIMQEVARDLGKTLVIEEMRFDSVIPAIQTRKADVGAAGITITEDRKRQVEFSIPYMESSQVIILTENSKIQTPEELKGKRIAVQQGATGDSYVTSHLQQPERFPNGALAVSALKAGKVDAVVLDAEPAKAHAAHQTGLKLLAKPLTTETYALVVRKGDMELLSKLNATLNRLKKNGKLDEIKAKYIK